MAGAAPSASDEPHHNLNLKGEQLLGVDARSFSLPSMNHFRVLPGILFLSSIPLQSLASSWMLTPLGRNFTSSKRYKTTITAGMDPLDSPPFSLLPLPPATEKHRTHLNYPPQLPATCPPSNASTHQPAKNRYKDQNHPSTTLKVQEPEHHPSSHSSPANLSIQSPT